MTETTTRVGMSEVIESLLALQRLYKLGELDGINLRESNGSVSLHVKSAESLAAWADALNCGPFARHVSRYEDRAPIHSAWTESLGWHISVTYYEPEPTVEADAAAIVAEVVAGEVTSPFGPCNGLAEDRRDNTCTNFAAEYVSYPSTSTGLIADGVFSPATENRRLCTACADAAPGVISRRPLTTDPNGYPVERAS